MHREPPDGWPLTLLEEAELEWSALLALWRELRADINDLTARVAEIERQRAREKDS